MQEQKGVRFSGWPQHKAHIFFLTYALISVSKTPSFTICFVSAVSNKYKRSLWELAEGFYRFSVDLNY